MKIGGLEVRQNVKFLNTVESLLSMFSLVLSVHVFISHRKNFSYLSKGPLYYIYHIYMIHFSLMQKNIVFINHHGMVKAVVLYRENLSYL